MDVGSVIGVNEGKWDCVIIYFYALLEEKLGLLLLMLRPNIITFIDFLMNYLMSKEP